MDNSLLEKAKLYELEAEKKISDIERPELHFSARTGWMNDPNGFSFCHGKYHLFYQYYPYDTHWGPMHWGHAASSDLICWEYLPVALAPDMVYDCEGCFSGSAVELQDGRHLIMYTAVSRENDKSDNNVQQQCLAIGDGVRYEKYENNPVIKSTDVPEDFSIYDFRDPKLIKVADGSYLSLIGSMKADRDGQVLLYTSKDGFCWSFKSILATNGHRFGTMWECPDFFELDGKWVLLISPTEMQASDMEYPNGHGTLCLMGEYDAITGKFTEESDQAVDYGIDFYAMQTVKAPDGRQIMIGWLQNWDTLNIRPDGCKWFGQMSIPRELSVVNGRLCQSPIRELLNYRQNEVRHEGVISDEELSIRGIEGRVIDMTINVSSVENDLSFFDVKLACDGHFYTELKYDFAESILKLSRMHSGIGIAGLHESCCKVDRDGESIDFRIILDRYSVEVFACGGRYVLSMAIWTEPTAGGISFAAKGKANIDVVKYDIVSHGVDCDFGDEYGNIQCEE